MRKFLAGLAMVSVVGAQLPAIAATPEQPRAVEGDISQGFQASYVRGTILKDLKFSTRHAGRIEVELDGPVFQTTVRKGMIIAEGRYQVEDNTPTRIVYVARRNMRLASHVNGLVLTLPVGAVRLNRLGENNIRLRLDGAKGSHTEKSITFQVTEPEVAPTPVPTPISTPIPTPLPTVAPTPAPKVEVEWPRVVAGMRSEVNYPMGGETNRFEFGNFSGEIGIPIAYHADTKQAVYATLMGGYLTDFDGRAGDDVNTGLFFANKNAAVGLGLMWGWNPGPVSLLVNPFTMVNWAPDTWELNSDRFVRFGVGTKLDINLPEGWDTITLRGNYSSNLADHSGVADLTWTPFQLPGGVPIKLGGFAAVRVYADLMEDSKRVDTTLAQPYFGLASKINMGWARTTVMFGWGPNTSDSSLMDSLYVRSQTNF